MKQILFIFFIGISVSPFLLHAHQIKGAGDLSVLLHVDPSDEPYSGTTTQMYLAFTDKSNQFQVEDCACAVYIAPYDMENTIEEEGLRIDVSRMERVLGSYSFSYIFPRHDVYSVVLVGNPKGEATFSPFRIEYALRVAHGEEIEVPIETLVPSKMGWNISVLLTGALISLCLIGILVGKRFYKK